MSSVTGSPRFHFFSDVARWTILDKNGLPAGSIVDIALTSNDSFPTATHLIIRRGIFGPRFASIPFSQILGLGPQIALSVSKNEIVYQPDCPYFEFTLVRDILDQQVVDTSGQKIIRVNDLELLQLDLELRISHVDVGIRGIVRRLGWQWWVDRFVQIFLARTDYFKENLINWRYVQPLAINPQKGTLKLTIRQSQLAQIPHADFTDLMQNTDMHKRLALFKSIESGLQPKVFSDFDLTLQTELLSNMDIKEAASILSKIPADQATDILEELPSSISTSLLASIETTQARRLSTLLGYTSDSAGGLMTTEMITVPHSARVSEVLARIRSANDKETMDASYYVFLLDEHGRLSGQVLIKRLLLSAPADPVAQYAYPKPIYVRAKDSLREVAFLMEKYKLPAVPVVNNGKEKLLQGVITIDDILAKVIPLAWRRRTQKVAP